MTLRRCSVVLALTALSVAAIPAAPAQTLTILHNFTGGTDGGQPQTGMTQDQHGNFYGTTQYGGIQNCDNGGVQGCGVLFKFKRTGSSWVLSPLHDFKEGDFPVSPGTPTVGPDGTLYGTTNAGGAGGLVYNATPTPSAPITGISFWNYDQLYLFSGGNDGGNPPRSAPVRFDAAGNFYGAANGGIYSEGVIFKMTPSGSGWRESVIYNFTGGSDGAFARGLTLDDQGNIYGTTVDGGNQGCGNYGCGTIFKLTRTGALWSITTLYMFRQGVDGGQPGTLMRDQAGNLYGLTYDCGPNNNGGTVWELSPTNGGWTFSVLHAFPTMTVYDSGPYPPAMDPAGNLYGITSLGGVNGTGSLFKLTPANGGGWTYADLHDFGDRAGHTDGCYPQGIPQLDAEGNIYSTTELCGAYGGGVLWMFTP